MDLWPFMAVYGTFVKATFGRHRILEDVRDQRQHWWIPKLERVEKLPRGHKTEVLRLYLSPYW
jgi:hypothetical protein